MSRPWGLCHHEGGNVFHGGPEKGWIWFSPYPVSWVLSCPSATAKLLPDVFHLSWLSQPCTLWVTSPSSLQARTCGAVCCGKGTNLVGHLAESPSILLGLPFLIIAGVLCNHSSQDSHTTGSQLVSLGLDKANQVLITEAVSILVLVSIQRYRLLTLQGREGQGQAG